MQESDVAGRAGEIIWRGRQWAVTVDGLETLGKPVDFGLAASQLADGWEGADESLLGWPMEVAAKTWVDYRDFETAFLVALGVHQGRYPELDLETIRASITEGRAMWEVTKAEMLGADDD
jgi:hypothetical protein